MIEGIVILIIMAVITIAANYALQERVLHRVVQAILVLVNLIIIVNSGLDLWASTLSEETRESLKLADVAFENALASFIIFAIAILVATALLFHPFRRYLARFFPRREAPSAIQSAEGYQLPSEPNAPALRGYDPANTIHMVALVFCVYLIGSQLGSFAREGGLAGIAETSQVDLVTLIANFLPQLIIPVLGVGIFMRRSLPEVNVRLGLTKPKSSMGIFPPWLEAIMVGAAVGVMMFIVVAVLALIWQQVVSPETFEAQNETSRAISESINTIQLALAVAFTAAVGEELTFRGGLQPIFGFWFTAIVFTAAHIQYTLTPASLIIFVVAIALGWLRESFNLWAAIAAHFVYNFVGLLISLAMNS